MKIKSLAFKKLLGASALALLFSHSPALAQIDPDASDKTLALYQNLKVIQNKEQFLFGQEFFNSFRYSAGGAHGEKEYSDSKAVTGAHPAVLGSDFHYYLDKSDTERAYHTEAVKWAYQQGYVITFDWHLSGRGTNTYQYDAATKDLANNIVNGLNGDREWYFGELDKAIAIINEDLVVEGEQIPIVFRPLHEMNGGWFWWGSRSTNPENFKTLFRLTVDYFKERTSTVLFCWSPNSPVNFNYYPGDEYVDILGLDAYEVTESSFRQQIAPIVDHAQANGKVAVFSETGNRTDNGEEASNYWKNTVLPGIVDDPSGKGLKIAWVLTWINASWSFPYVPHPNSSQAAKQSFIAFKEAPQVLFGDEIPSMYEQLALGIDETKKEQERDDLKLYPMPNTNELHIHLKGFAQRTAISIYDMNGKLVYQMKTSSEKTKLNVQGILEPGMYLVKAFDRNKTISKKLLIK